MAETYRIFGSELSPYSVKVRSYFRYKQIPHEWVERSAKNQEEFDRHARLPLIPLVITPDGKGIQDSTPIIERFEREHPQPSIHPPDPALGFLSALIEEYADEWGNKPMFHYRWFYEPDQESAAERIARQMMPDATEESLRGAMAMIRERMVGRLPLVGSSAQTKDIIESSFLRQVDILEAHLAERPYLFGGRPAFADFGMYAQMYQCGSDPTPGKLLRERGPRVCAWIERMLDPQPREAGGQWESWESLRPTLLPLLRDEVGAVFLPWSSANEKALRAGEKEFAVEIGGRPFRQETQKYHAKSLGVLRARYAAVEERTKLGKILEEAGCLTVLQG